jgi:hypothetical protein
MIISRRSFLKSLTVVPLLSTVPINKLFDNPIKQFWWPKTQTVGLIFPIFNFINQNPQYECYIKSFPVFNNQEGWNIAMKIEKNPHFKQWADNPWIKSPIHNIPIEQKFKELLKK